MRRIFLELAPVEKHMRLVSMQFDLHPALCQVTRAMNVLEPGQDIAVRRKRRRSGSKTKGFSERVLPQMLPMRRLFGVRARNSNPAMRAGVTVVENDQRALVAIAVGIGKHVLIDVTVLGEKVIE